MTDRDLQELELAAQLIITVIERARVHDENAEERRRQFTMTTNRAFWQTGGKFPSEGESPVTVAPMHAAEEEKPAEERDFITKRQRKWGILTFTEKEILKMPKEFKKQYLAGKITAHVRQKENGVYEIRTQINYHPISASSKNLKKAKQKFAEKIAGLKNNLYPSTPTTKPKKTVTLGEYMLKWLDTVKKPFVKPITYKDYVLSYKANIFPAFGKRTMSEISQFELQAFLNSYLEQGKNRTALKLYQILTALFEYAVIDDLVKKSPMQKVVLPRYEQKNGMALTREEEKTLVNLLLSNGNPYAQAFVFLIYTGLRRSELASVIIDNGWITLITSKTRKGYKEKTRALPISPMLAPLLPIIDIQAIKKISVALLTKYFKKWLPEHHLHDTRHTFITRAQECGIPRELVSLWAGHAADCSTTTTVYTHLEQNREIQIKEIEKFSYAL